MEQRLTVVALWCLAVILLATVILLVRQRRITGGLRRRMRQLEDSLRARDEEVMHLVTTRLPALMESRYHRPADVPPPLHARLSGTAYSHSLHTVLQLFGEAVNRARTRAEQTAKSTLKAMMRSVQSLANEQQVAISTMQDRHDRPDVLEDLLKIDHTNSQLGRRAQATAVLCGSWPGQQRSASPLIDVVRGATSRIRDYLRVQVHAQVDISVVSRAVEPVVLALAEVLDNAARHSQPNTSVEVNFQQAHNGMAVVVDDAGVGMSAEDLQHATTLLSGDQDIDINRLGDPPQVGFAVIGVLCARYGFTVSVDTRSPYGGVRAVVFLPNALLTRTTPRFPVSPGGSAAGPAAGPVPAGPASPPSREGLRTAGGLPKRRRRAVEEAPVARPPAATADTPSGRPARQVAAGLGAWQRGTKSGRGSTSSDSEGTSTA